MPVDLLAQPPKKNQPRDLLANAPEGSGGDDGFLAFVNQSIASGLGAPVDVMRSSIMGEPPISRIARGAYEEVTGNETEPLLPSVGETVGVNIPENAFGGSQSIAQGMGRAGMQVAEPGEKPETIPEYIGQGVGGAASALLPGAGVVGAASRAASPVVRGTAQTVSRPFISSPGRAMASETGAGAGSGLALSIADEVAPDNPYAQITAALLGGAIGGVGPNLAARGARSLPGVQLGENFIAGQVAPFTEKGAMSRARGRIGGMVEDPETARANLEGGTIGDLSPAVASGDRRLMGLEQAVRDQEAPIDRQMRQNETASMDTLREAAAEPGQEAPREAARRVLSDRVNNLVQSMQKRTADAVERAQNRVNELQPRNRQAQSSVIVREELEDALKAARQQEREIWGAVPKEEPVPTSTAKAAYRDIVEDMPRAQRDTIPAKARDFLEEGGNQTFKDQETVNEVHGLYSALRENARAARAANEANKARISDKLADALLDDLGAAQGAEGSLREALDFSRELNRTFRQGNVGRVLGSERTGGQSVAPELTLETTVGRGGVRGAVALDELSGATGGQSAAVPDFVQSRAYDASVRDGRLSPQRARNFQRQNRELLDRTPSAQKRITDAIMDTERATDVESRMGTRQAAVEAGPASRFAGAQPGTEIQTILRSENPKEVASQLMRQVRRDETGQAGNAIKGALVDDLMNSARMRQFDEAGQPMVSGRALKSRLADERFGAAASEILSENELSRLNQIADEFARIETMQGRLPDVGDIMGDEPNSLVSTIARVIAARQGAELGGSGGASLQTAQMASSRMQRVLRFLTNDKAEQLIKQAVTGDKELFDALLLPPSQMSRQQELRVVEALGGTAGAAAAQEDDPQSRVSRALTGQ